MTLRLDGGAGAASASALAVRPAGATPPWPEQLVEALAGRADSIEVGHQRVRAGLGGLPEERGTPRRGRARGAG